MVEREQNIQGLSNERLQPMRTLIRQLVEKVDEQVTLMGWVHSKRHHGKLIFVDLRDESGLAQIVFNPATKDAFKIANSLKDEFVISVQGPVKKRTPATVNPKISSGTVEVSAEAIEIINKADDLPFLVNKDEPVNENLRFRYRYLDLRREGVRENLLMRHRIIKSIRDFIDEREFIEVETPILTKGTPEGAREYLVPSRLNKGEFYVLPQSPQQFKQLLMVGGIGRYFQIARCFRDEDLRGDRQPEFTQLDIEQSFVSQEEIMGLVEELLVDLAQKFNPDKSIQFLPFKRIAYAEALSRYGSDKPDLRFDLEIKDATSIFTETGINFIQSVINQGGKVRVIKASNLSLIDRDIRQLTQAAIDGGAKGLFQIQFLEDSIKSSVAAHINKQELERLRKEFLVNNGDTLLFVADTEEIANKSLGVVRLELAKSLGYLESKKDQLAFTWVTDFPLFELSSEEKKIVAVHHPFTAPNNEDLDYLESEPLRVRAKAYDIVLNGVEIGGGSIRIHEPDLQKKIFQILGLSNEEVNNRFGHLLRAFRYGAPPHGGIALGLDRLIMILEGATTIRDVIAFPKNQSAQDLLMGAPSRVNENLLDELGIQLKPKEQNKKG